MIEVKLMPHGVYQGYADGTPVAYAVRLDPVAAAYRAVRWLLWRYRLNVSSMAKNRLPMRLDRPTYRVRRDRFWYLHEDYVFFHWTSADSTRPRRPRRPWY